MKGFSHASWGAEVVDADEDGYQELLFVGKDPSESRNLRRLILFVPNDKRTYSAQLTGETTARGTPRIQWLSNAAGTDAAAYRTALRQKARAIIAKKRIRFQPQMNTDFMHRFNIISVYVIRFYLWLKSLSCTIFEQQDNLFPATNINLQHMELSVKRSFLVILLLLTLLSPSTLSARVVQQQQRAPRPTATAPAAAPARLPEAKLISHVLPNGLEVIILEDHSIPLVTIELAVKNGSYTEPPELNGLSHLYEHMFFKQNRAIANAEDYLRTIGQMGIAYNGTTREEVVDYYFTTTSPNIRTAMQFMKDATRYPLFDEREFSREKQVVIGEIDRNESNPFFYLSKEMNSRLFSKYPSRKNPLGNRETVGGATTEMMRLIQQRYYVPNNSATRHNRRRQSDRSDEDGAGVLRRLGQA